MSASDSKAPRATSPTAALPAAAAVVCALLLALWWMGGADRSLQLRLPNTDRAATDAGARLNPAAAGLLVLGSGTPAADSGTWPQFRGPDRTGISAETKRLAHSWSDGGPRELWGAVCGEGYAGAAVRNGRVYLMDYDGGRKKSALRCLSAADGREIWRYEYPLPLKRNHGVTRTVPTLAGTRVVAMDSLCNVVCADAESGKVVWTLNLVREFGATVPPWYAGQCPLVDGGSVILGVGGTNALVVSVELATGKVIWKSPNPRGWKMTHSCVTPMEFNGRRQYVYCGSGGVCGVAADDGTPLWDTTEWKISIANVPAPLALGDGRIFLCGGYNAGAAMLQLKADQGRIAASMAFRLPPDVFGATQHTPIVLGDHLYGVRPNGQFACLDFNGHVAWASPAEASFGLGSFLLADGVFYVLNDNGRLTSFEATPAQCRKLGETQILTGMESWAPMALVNGKLYARDFTKLACFDLTAK
jgi:outer membrane protein assembly factor BamB